jgi:hypothetical protein
MIRYEIEEEKINQKKIKNKININKKIRRYEI